MRVVDGHVRFVVRARPRASREGIALDAAKRVIIVKVRAAPVDGAANAAIIDAIADVLEVRKSDVSIVRGDSARDKDIEVRGAARDEVIAKLAAALSSSST